MGLIFVAALTLAQVCFAAAAPGSVPSRAAAGLAALPLLALVRRRRHPLGALAAVLAAVVAQAALLPHADPAVSFLALMVATYTVAVEVSGWPLPLALLTASATVGGAQQLAASQGYSTASALAFGVTVLVLLPALTGRLVRSRNRLTARLQTASARLEQVHGEQIALAVEQERTRLAGQVESALLSGLEELRRHADVLTLRSAMALEATARGVLARMRELLAGWHAHPVPEAASVRVLRARISALLAGEDTAASRGLPDAEASRGLPHTAAAPVVPRVVLPSTRELDVVLRGVAAVLLVGLIVRQLDTGAAAGAGWLRIGLLAAVAVPVAWLRRAPLLAGGLSGAALVVHAAVARPADPLAGLVLVVPLLLCPLAAGAGLGRGPAVGGLIGCLMVPALLIAADPAARFAPEELAPAWAVVIGCWAAGRALRAQVALLATLADAAAQLDEEQRALARARLEVEHARVAHELHDRIAHAMTIIALQAAAARRVWTADPVRAREHVAALRLTVLETVQELRPLLLSLSRGAGHAGEMPPGEARLAALPVLVDQARAAGLRAALRICGAPPASIAPAVDLAGYRVVQEALTNAARHAPGSRVTVTVRYDGPEVRIRVVNGPSARRRVDPPLPSAGHGLAGMRARVDACRGDFEAAPAPHGGFAVTARLPVPVTA